YDKPMWEAISARAMRLQRCSACGTFRYPPGPSCQACLSPAHDWTPVSGKGEIVSWAIFHRKYLPDYPPPYNVIADRRAECLMMISTREVAPPPGSWIGSAVELVYVEFCDRILPRFRLAGAG